MKKRRSLMILALAGMAAFRLMAHEGHEHGGAAGKVTKVALKGQILDMTCFMNEGAKGPKHKDCALKCVKEGAPVGFLSQEGKAYFLVNDHDNEDAYAAAKGLAAA